LTFGADTEMTQRYLLTSVAAAHHARNASTLGGLPASAFAQVSGANFTGNVTAPGFIGNLQGNATSATSFSGLLAGDVTGTQSSTVVGSVGGVTAANVATGANLANAATDSSVAGAIVRRNTTNQGFSAGPVTIDGSGLSVQAPITTVAPITTAGPLFITGNNAPIIFGTGNQGTLVAPGLTASRSWTLPNSSG
jgi:hypothetical protein